MRSKTSLTFQAGSRFLPEDAERIHAVLAATPNAEIDLDFRGVRECHPAALPKLARLLSHGAVRIRGLTERHASVMRYLGATSAAVAQPAALPDLP